MKFCVLLFATILFLSCQENKKTTIEIESSQPSITDSISKIKNGEPPYEHLIIPGKRMGNIVLDHNASAILDSLGKPDSADAAMGKSVATYEITPGKKLTLYTIIKMGVEDFRRIKLIRTTSERYKTYNHLGVNSSLEEIKNRFTLEKIGSFTENTNQYSLYDTSEGIAFEINNHDVCTGILVHSPARDATQSYLPIYSDFNFQMKKQE